MATSNAQLTKLAIGITAVAALAAITGSLSAGAAAPSETAQANPNDNAGQQLNSAPQSSGLFGLGGDDNNGEGADQGYAFSNNMGSAQQSRRSPQFANPGTTGSSGHTRSKHS